MGFLDVFKGKFSDLSTKVKQYKNKDMLEAIVAGCALVAYADGVVDTSEKAKMMGFIQNSPELSVFGMSDV
ncbi:MAG: Tellurite resistance TerB, partial [Synergistales bacterium]|nr:Tellurite resistance TerB [Synergistales bacterium]